MAHDLPEFTDFTDLPKKPSPNLFGGAVRCPKCHTHGYCNVRLNAYGPGRHYQRQCDNCHGWGWVLKGSANASCIHHYERVYSPRMFEHVLECTKCENQITVDSSG